MEATLAHNTIGNTLDDARAIKRTGIGDTAPTVSVIDGDISVRHSLDRFIRTAGWEPGPTI